MFGLHVGKLGAAISGALARPQPILTYDFRDGLQASEALDAYGRASAAYARDWLGRYVPVPINAPVIHGLNPVWTRLTGQTDTYTGGVVAVTAGTWVYSQASGSVTFSGAATGSLSGAGYAVLTTTTGNLTITGSSTDAQLEDKTGRPDPDGQYRPGPYVSALSGYTYTTTLSTSHTSGALHSLRVVTEDASNWFVDWGDGTAQTFASGATASRTYSGAYTGPVVVRSPKPILELRQDQGRWNYTLDALPPTLTNFHCTGINTVSGSLSDLPSALTVFNCHGINTISGSLSDLPSTLTYFECRGNNTISGSLSDLPSALTFFSCAGNNTISGSLSDLPSALTHFNCTGSNTVTGPGWGGVSVNAQRCFVLGTGLSQTQVDEILVGLDDNTTSWMAGQWYSNPNIDLRGNNAAPSATGLAAKTSLEGKGATVFVNT